jgi:hypothetical protein
MSFKLRIRGRDYFEPSTAANPANPLILPEQEADLPTAAANDATVQDLTQHTISRLAGLAGPAIAKAKPYPCLSEADHIRAKAYHLHHFGCKTCCAAGQGRGERCEIGMGLWTTYQNEAKHDEHTEY